MSAVKAPPRLTKGSKARAAAKRRLPKLLAKSRRKELAGFRKAKRNRPPRLLQRKWRLEAKEKVKKAAAEKASKLAAFLGIKTEAA